MVEDEKPLPYKHSILKTLMIDNFEVFNSADRSDNVKENKLQQFEPAPEEDLTYAKKEKIKLYLPTDGETQPVELLSYTNVAESIEEPFQFDDEKHLNEEIDLLN